jgi:hypothetical protein
MLLFTELCYGIMNSKITIFLGKAANTVVLGTVAGLFHISLTTLVILH